MTNLASVTKARMAGMTVAAVALPMLSLAALAGPPVQKAAFETATIVSTQGNKDVVSVAVPYADLNLANEQGIAALNARIKSAVEKVCGSPDPRELSRTAAARECRDAAIADAMAQVAMVTAPRPVVAAR